MLPTEEETIRIRKSEEETIRIEDTRIVIGIDNKKKLVTGIEKKETRAKEGILWKVDTKNKGKRGKR